MRAPKGPSIAASRSSQRPSESAMADYELHYWQLPFRGQFIRAILAWSGQRWDEFDGEAIGREMDADVARQRIPFQGPPMLVDRRSGFALAQMPAIAWWLGER